MALTDLEGASTKLKLVTDANLAKLHERMQIKEVWDMAGCREAPDMARLKKRLHETKHLISWELHDKQSRAHLGYVNIIIYSGPAYLQFDFFAKPNVDLAIDATLAILPAYFANTPEQRLFFHVPVALADDLHGVLVENGFDPTASPFWPTEQWTSYVLERQTFQAYAEAMNDT